MAKQQKSLAAQDHHHPGPRGLADHQLPAQGPRRARLAGGRRPQQGRRDLLLRYRRRHHRGSRHARVSEGAHRPRAFRRRAGVIRLPAARLRSAAQPSQDVSRLTHSVTRSAAPSRPRVAPTRPAAEARLFASSGFDRRRRGREAEDDGRSAQAGQRPVGVLRQDAEPAVAGRGERHGLAGRPCSSSSSAGSRPSRWRSSTRRFRRSRRLIESLNRMQADLQVQQGSQAAGREDQGGRRQRAPGDDPLSGNGRRAA